MADIHCLIVKHGVDEARRQAITKHERAVVEAAYQVLSEDADKIGFTYSGFALKLGGVLLAATDHADADQAGSEQRH